MSDSMDKSWGNGHPSAPQLDGFLLGEFEGAARESLAHHISSCPQCARKIEAAQSFRADGPEERILATLQQGLERKERPQHRKYGLLALAAAAIVAVLLVAPRLIESPRNAYNSAPTLERSSEIRLKGPPITLLLYRLVAGDAVPVTSSVPLKPGDRLQAATVVASAGYVALYDVMPAEVVLLASASDGLALNVRPGQEWPLEPAFELDVLEAGEHFVLLFCPTSFAPGSGPISPAGFANWEPADGCSRVTRAAVPQAEGTVQ